MISLSIFVLFNSLLLSTIEAERNSFSIDLIHRDSILSPLQNSSNTLQKNVVNQFNSSMYLESDMSHTSGEYLMKINISKSYEVLAIASLTSDLIWIQCAPCDALCYTQDKPHFEPSKSTTYEAVLRGSKTCTDFGHQAGEDGKYCLYEYKSGKDKFTSGVLSTETFYLSSGRDRHPLQKKVFGCGTQNLMTVPTSVQGVIGLGRGDFSLVSRLRSKIGEKYSYCLRNGHKDTKLRFGRRPPIHDRTATLKLFQPPSNLRSSLYLLKLKAIGVEDKKFQVSGQDGDVILDIGTSLTYLHGNVYDELIENVKKVAGKNMKRVEDSTGTYELCYKEEDVLRFGLPDMVFSFSASRLSGSDLILTSSHTFRKSGQNNCMMITRSSTGHSVLGSWAQKNFRVEYEPNNNKVTFIKTDCDGHVW